MRRTFWNKKPRKIVEKDDGVEIVFKKPPIYNDLCAAFNIRPVNVVYTYGDKIYNPDKLELPPEIIEHEKVHMKQQKAWMVNEDRKFTPALWWGKYLRDAKFRIDQEAKGYARQYDVICQDNHDRNQRARYLWGLASSLSGVLYNNEISHSEATKMIKKLSKY